MELLFQFLLRLSFGTAAAMLCVSARHVTSGYYRNNLYVLLGLNVLAALLAWLAPANSDLSLWPVLLAGAACYLGAAAWLYENAGLGLLALTMVGAGSLTGAFLSLTALTSSGSPARQMLWALDPVAGGAVLGVTMAAMLLGHWYLNAPGMPLEPLKRLVALMIAVLVVRGALAACGAVLEYRSATALDLSEALFAALRWLSGIVGAMVVAIMTRQTLKVPNTQSATGILYVGVILTFIGELTAMLLSRGKLFPL